jgi:hypothetical protein
MEFSNQRWGVGLMLIAAALGFLSQILASQKTLLLVLCVAFFVSGVLVLIWPYLRKESDLKVALRLRNQLQKLLDDIGEEPKIKYGSEKEFSAQLEKWRKHKLQLVHRFRRRHLPQIQDFIHRLGEKGITDAPLNIMIDKDPKDYAAIKEITDRLSVIASRMANEGRSPKL